VSANEPSYAVNVGIANRQRDVDLLHASLRPQNFGLAWLAWLGVDLVAKRPERRHTVLTTEVLQCCGSYLQSTSRAKRFAHPSALVPAFQSKAPYTL
jgi:hypothetical protein